MPSPETLNFESLLTPIPDGNPAGRSLRYSDVYDAIRDARRSDAPVGLGDRYGEIKVADWHEVAELTTQALRAESKDLQLAAWLTEALVKRGDRVRVFDNPAVLPRGRSPQDLNGAAVTAQGRQSLGGTPKCALNARENWLTEAKRFARWFCSNCGGPLPRYTQGTGFVVIPAGSLDSDPVMRPQARIFWDSRADWSCSDDGIPVYPEYPPGT